MTIDDLLTMVDQCDDDTSRRLPNGARFIRHLPDQGPLAFFHYLPAAADDEVLSRVEAAMNRNIPSDLRGLLQVTNGPCLFDKSLRLYGAEERLSRSLRLEDQKAISIMFENQTFSERSRWNEGWMTIGSVSGWSTQHELQANVDGRCAIVSKEGRIAEFHSLAKMLGLIVETLSTLIPCQGITDNECGPLENALGAMVQ